GPATLQEQQKERQCKEERVCRLHERQPAQPIQLIEPVLREPVDVLKVQAGDGVGEAILVEQHSLLGEEAAAGEVVPDGGLVVAGGDRGEKRKQRHEEQTHPGIGRPEGMVAGGHESVCSGGVVGILLLKSSTQATTRSATKVICRPRR